LEQLQHYGYSSWINDLKTLVVAERVELVGSAAYHPLLTKIDPAIAETEIILNEFGLGYFLGMRQGFEGEPAVMLKNLKGFFPPELAISDAVTGLVSDLGYSWLVADVPALGALAGNTEFPFTHYYRVSDFSAKVLIRDRELSNMLAFKRTPSIEDVIDYIEGVEEKISSEYVGFVCLDGETFGHHYQEGISTLSLLIDYLNAKGSSILSITELSRHMDGITIDTLSESTWGDVEEDVVNETTYKFWANKKDLINQKLWELDNVLQKHATNNLLINIDTSNMTELFSTKQDNLKNTVALQILKCLHSDKFWWSSSAIVYPNMIINNKHFISKFIEYVDSSLALLHATNNLIDINNEKKLLAEITDLLV